MKNLSSWVKCLTFKRLDCPITYEDTLEVDDSLCWLEKVDGYDRKVCKLQFYHPLYEELSFEEYFKEIQTEIRKLLSNPDYIDELLPNTDAVARGIAMEKYILDRLVFNSMMPHSITQAIWKFSPYDANGNLLPEITLKVEDFRNRDVVENNLYTLFVEHLQSELRLKNITDLPNSLETEKIHNFSGKLFIPSTRYMKFIDAFFFDAKNLNIFLFQITTNINTHKQSDKDFYDFASKLFGNSYF